MRMKNYALIGIVITTATIAGYFIFKFVDSKAPLDVRPAQLQNRVLQQANSSAPGSNKGYNQFCAQDMDCVSITKMTSCYKSCETLSDGCKSAPKCSVVKKTDRPNEIFKTCDISQFCKDPKNIKCVNSKCVGEW